MDNDKIVNNQSPEVNTEILQELFCRGKRVLLRNIYKSHYNYAMSAWAADQFLDSVPEDKEEEMPNEL